MTNTAATARTRMTAKVTRWYYAEVAREWVANDNVDAATWAAEWTKVAEMMEAKNWMTQARQMRAMVAVARQVNRPKSV